MNLRHLIQMVPLGVVTLAGCDDKPPAASSSSSSSTAPARSEAAAPLAGGPHAALDELDPRTAVPLQPMMAWHQKQNMQEHLVAIQGIVEGLASEDWDAIAKASALIESSPQMQQMCQHMGAGAPGFTELALGFHERADAIGEAARAHDGPAVLSATSNTLLACTGCHASYRQELVDAETWAQRTGSDHDPAAMHGGH